MSRRPACRYARSGEASFVNNLTTLHARSEFDDWDEADKKRLMLRLWLDTHHDARPSVREIHIYENKDGASGIDPVPGRLPAVAQYHVPAPRPRVAPE